MINTFVNDIESKFEFGVLQGFIFGPLLFLMFINDLHLCLICLPGGS